MSVYKILYEKEKKRNMKLKRSLESEREKGKRHREKICQLRKSLATTRKENAILSDGYVVEWCINCNRQVTMLWDVEADGLSAVCPHCGAIMMLCEQCPGDCDYDYGIDVCKEM